MFLDSHAHLEPPHFDADRADMLARAAAAGVETVLAIGTGDGPGTLDCAINLADAVAASTTPHPRIFATVGVHPHEATRATDADFAQLAALARNPHVIAWGEIGIDYYYDHSPRDVQYAVFTRQMKLAQAARLPIIIHCRPSANPVTPGPNTTGGDSNNYDAWDDCLALLREHWAPTGLGGILHCFAGTVDHARQGIEMGFLISFAGNVTFPKAQPIRDAALAIPLEHMLIETDSPFLAPIPFRGKRNEPAFVVNTAAKIAELRGTTAEEIGQITAANFRRLFPRTQ